MSEKQTPSGRRAQMILIPAAVFLTALMLYTAAQMAWPERLGLAGSFLDFHVFYLVGQLGLAGEVGQAYHAEAFLPVQQARPGYTEFLPYSYPPHATLATLALALLPDWAGYLSFMGGSVLALFLVLRRLAPDHAALAFVLVMPAVFVAVRSGQNGAMSATLIGLVCLWWGRRALAGVPLGLMTYKPHVALGLGLAVLLRLRWRVIAVAALVCGGLLLAATLVLGPGIWADFLNGAGESAGLLDAGLFPYHRMASVYALLQSLGLSAGVSMALHLVPALVAVLALGRACLNGWDSRRILALSVMAGLMISPYLYDYDVAAASVALALAGPEIAGAERRWRLALGGGVLMASGWGLIHSWAKAQGIEITPALGGLGLVVGFAALLVILARAERR